MKILMLADYYPPLIGGIERHVQSLSRELNKRGHEVTVCTIGHRDLPEYEEKDGVRIYRLEGFFQKIPFLFPNPKKKFPPPTQDWLISRQLKRIIEEGKPDILHAHGWFLCSVLPLKKNLKIPLVVTFHDYGFLCPKITLISKNVICNEPFTRNCIVCGRGYHGFVRHLAAYYGVKSTKNKLESVDKFITISSFAKEIYSKHLGLRDKNIAMIPNFCAPDIEEKEKKAVSNLPEDFILFVGALTPYKGVDMLIEAYQKLSIQTKLVLIGGKLPDYYYKSTEDILVIENAPHDTVMQAFSNCRFAVFPSICPEPGPIVALEAMSQKKAIIASDAGGLKDIVVDRETGILIPPNNPDKLSEAIYQLLQRPEIASEMGAKGYERFMKNYTPDVVIPRVLDLYESLI